MALATSSSPCRLESVLHITKDFLADNFPDVQFLILDVDDTLSGRLEPQMPDQVLRHLVELIEGVPIKGVVLVSDVTLPAPWLIARLNEFADQLGATPVPALWPVLKPNPAPMLKALVELGPSANGANTLVVGDRLDRDVLGARNAGIQHVILVAPYSSTGGWWQVVYNFWWCFALWCTKQKRSA